MIAIALVAGFLSNLHAAVPTKGVPSATLLAPSQVPPLIALSWTSDDILRSLGAPSRGGAIPVSVVSGKLVMQAPVSIAIAAGDGCGMLISQPAELLVPGDGDNVVFLKGKDLVESPPFRRLAAEVQVSYLSEWSRLRDRQEELDRSAIDVNAALARAEENYRRLEASACDYVREASRVRQRVEAFNSRCQGQVDEGTRFWCLAEEGRLRGELSSVDAMYMKLVSAHDTHTRTYAQPAAELTTRWAKRVQAWEGDLREFIDRLKAVLPCPSCQPYPAGTVGFIGPHTDHDHYPIGRPHLNLFRVNQNQRCECFWNNNTPEVAAPPPLPEWIDLNNGFPTLTP